MTQRSSLFTIGQPPGRHSYWLIGLGVFVLLGLAWYLSTASDLVPRLFLPAPADVLARMLSLAADGTCGPICRSACTASAWPS